MPMDNDIRQIPDSRFMALAAAAAQGEYLRVSARIKEANPNWQKFMTVTPEALKTGQKNIPLGVLFVQYAPLGDQLYIFLVGKEP
jgi:hypothetical protein